MSTKVLITYATTHGSTKEIAEVITDTIRNRGIEADIQPIRKVKSLESYSLVMLGAPLYMFRWHKDAHRFLKKHQQVIKNGLPVAVFAGGPLEPATDKEWQDVNDQLDKALAKHPWFKPHSVQIVGGKFNPEELRFPYNMVPVMRNLEACDLRDWEAIRSWARTQISQTQAI